MTPVTSVDEYLAAIPEEARAALEKVRKAVKAAAPEAVEMISYQMPAFKYRGRPLVYFGAAKNHCALYGISVDAHKDELDAYDTSKGTVRFPAGKPPPDALVKKLVKARIGEIEAAAAKKARKKA